MTLRTASTSTVFTLEGTLTGLWSKELLRIVRLNEQGVQTIFDIQGISFIDSAGKEALQTLNKRGASFITNSAFGKDLCNRLHLCRVSSPEEKTFAGAKRPVHKPTNRRASAMANSAESAGASRALHSLKNPQ